MKVLEGTFYNLCLQALAEDSIDCIETFFLEGNLLMPKKATKKKTHRDDDPTHKRTYRCNYYQKAVEPIVEKFARTGKISEADKSKLAALRTESHKSYMFLGLPMELIIAIE